MRWGGLRGPFFWGPHGASSPVTPLWSLRLAFGDGGELSVDGFCTVDEAEGEILGLGAAGGWGRSSSSSLCLAKYLLSVLGGPFCAAVRRDRDAWMGAHGQPGGKRAPRGGPQKLGGVGG